MKQASLEHPEQQREIVLAEPDPAWPQSFAAIAAEVRAAIGPLVLAVEHVGSTAVPGLRAKPIIDLDIAVAAADMQAAITSLEAAGWKHRGDLGIPERDAFEARAGLPAHHLYLCPAGSREMKRHLAFRDRLRADPALATRYGKLKADLAAHAAGIAEYVDGKSDFIETVLAGELSSEK